jgi:uncharacterized OB-fold protein
LNTGVPEGLVAAVEAHGKAVAAADNEAVLADFLPDRIGQLIASADVPNRLKGSEVRNITGVEDERYDAVIRYTKPDDDWFELRSRWVQFEDGTWRVFSVRNIPDTPPWMAMAGPSDDGLDTPHWDGLREGRLVLQQCCGCANWIWAPRPMCPQCHSFELQWRQVEPVGTIYSWTRTWQPFSGEAAGHLPYVVVLVELPAAGNCRVVGVLAHADGVQPTIGATGLGHIESPPDNEHWPLIRWQLEAGRR